MVHYPVMLGFVNGLALVIFMAQFSNYKIAAADGTSVCMSGQALYVILGLTALTMAVFYLLPNLTTAIPSSLAAILIVAGLVTGLGIETKQVGDMGSIAGGLPQFHLPQVPLTLE